MITCAEFKLRKQKQMDRRAAQRSRQKSGAPQGKVQQEVNIYRNGPRGENKSSPKITDVFSKLQNLFTLLLHAAASLSLYGRTSAP